MTGPTPASGHQPPQDLAAPECVPPDLHRPFGLYFHFPFCAARCHYCAFTFVVGQEAARAPYLAAMRRELGAMARDPRFAGREVGTVFFGGGTPSLMAGDDVAGLLAAAREAFGVADDAEVSLESNPDGLDAAKLAELREAGVNRLTLGWQSMRAEGLAALTRTHSAEHNARSMASARAAGFENVGVDLMFGWPGHGIDTWRAELREVVALAPDHVSAYELTVEEGTRLQSRVRAGRYVLADEDERADMFEAVDTELAPADIRRYEISNFARPGFECRHNLSGWRSGDLLGIGVSAASHVTNARWFNEKSLETYVKRVDAGEPALDEEEVLDPGLWAAEDLYLGLRTVEGVDAVDRLQAVEAADRGRLLAALEVARERGFVQGSGAGDRVSLTRMGRLMSDTVFELLLEME